MEHKQALVMIDIQSRNDAGLLRGYRRASVWYYHRHRPELPVPYRRFAGQESWPTRINPLSKSLQKLLI
jgi:hypothetical protein